MLSEPMIFSMKAAHETLPESRRHRVVVVHPAAKADCIAAKPLFFFFFPSSNFLATLPADRENLH